MRRKWTIGLPAGHFDAVLCGLGLMYMPDPEAALAAMVRRLRPGGRLVASVWGERRACGWAKIFPIVDERVRSEVCPMFFRLGSGETLARALQGAGLDDVQAQRLTTQIVHADAQVACDAAFLGGPVALAYSRFDARTRDAVRSEYLAVIKGWYSEGATACRANSSLDGAAAGATHCRNRPGRSLHPGFDVNEETALDTPVLEHNQRAAAVWSSGGKDYDRVSHGIADALEHCVRSLDLSPASGRSTWQRVLAGRRASSPGAAPAWSGRTSPRACWMRRANGPPPKAWRSTTGSVMPSTCRLPTVSSTP